VLIVLAGNSLSLPRPHRIKQFDPAEERELAIHYEETYSHLLENGLRAFYPDRLVSVQNRSQRGYTIVDILQQFDDHLYYFQPNLIIMHIGIVDCWYRKELDGRTYVNIQNFTKSYLTIINRMRLRPETKLLVIGIAPTTDRMEERYPGIREQIGEYNHVLQCGADNEQIYYLDLIEDIAPCTERYLLPDDQHLNREGNRLVYHKLMAMIGPIMERLQR
jgi:lysophospholipase L1-like esterase